MQVFNVNYMPVQSFKGKFKSESDEYVFQSGHSRMQYNKENGSFEYRDKNQTHRFNLQKCTETVITKTKEGTKTETVSPVLYSVVKKDRDDFVVYSYKLNKTTQDSIETKYDEELNRQIITTVKNGEKSVKVYDYDKRQFVDEGEKTLFEEFDEEKNIRRIRNVVKDIVLEEESSNPENRYLKKFNSETGAVLYEEYINKKGDKKEIIERDNTGDILSHIIVEENRKIKAVTHLIPNTRKIEKVISDYKDKSGDKVQRTDIYRIDPNVRKTSEIFNKTKKRIVEKTLYHEDGTTPAVRVSHLDDGTKTKFKYDSNGYLTELTRYNAFNFAIFYAQYHKNTNKKFARTIEIDPVTKETKEYKYDTSGEKYTYHYFRDSKGKLTESAVYFRNSNQINIKFEYKDNYCIKTQFDNIGRIISKDKIQYQIPDASQLPSDEQDFEDLFRQVR